MQYGNENICGRVNFLPRLFLCIKSHKKYFLLTFSAFVDSSNFFTVTKLSSYRSEWPQEWMKYSTNRKPQHQASNQCSMIKSPWKLANVKAEVVTKVCPWERKYHALLPGWIKIWQVCSCFSCFLLEPLIQLKELFHAITWQNRFFEKCSLRLRSHKNAVI